MGNESHSSTLRRIEASGSKGDQRAAQAALDPLRTRGGWQAGQKDLTFRQTEARPDCPCCVSSGRPRKSDHPEQPFWRLQRDGVWIVHAPSGLETKKGAEIPPRHRAAFA